MTAGIRGTSAETVTVTSGAGAGNLAIGQIGSGDEISVVALTSGTGTTTLSGNITTADVAGNGVTITGPLVNGVAVGGTLTIDADNTTNDGNVTITGATTGAGRNLVIQGKTITTGAITSTGGSNQAGGSVALTGSAGVTVGGAIIASGGTVTTGNAGRNAGAVSITGGDVTVAAITASGSAGLGTNQNGGTGGAITLDATDGSPTITLGGGLTAAGGARTGTGTAGNGGAITVSDAATLTAAVTANASGGTGGGTGGGITFAGSINGNTAGTRALVLTGGTGDVSVAGAIGATNALSALTVTGNDISLASIGTSGAAGVTGATAVTAVTNGSDTGSIALTGVVRTTGTQTYAGSGLPLTIGGDLITANQNITVANSLSLQSAAEISVGTATMALNGTVSAGSNALTLTGDEINLAANLSGTGALTLRPGSTTAALSVGAANSTTANQLDLTIAELTLIQSGFSAVVLGRSDSSGNVAVNPITAGTLKNGTTLQTGTGTITLAGDTATSGQDLTFNGATQLTGNRTVATAGGTITFTGAVTGNAAGRNLTLQAGAGAITVSGNAGTSGTRLGTISADSTAPISFGGTVHAGVLTLANTSSFTASGTVDLTGAVTVPASVTNASFLGGLTANSASFANSGTLTLGDAGSDTSTISAGLNTTGVGGTVSLGGTVQTTNQQIDLGAVTLGAATVLSAGSAALNAGAVSGGGNALTVQGSGTTTLASASNLGALAISATGGSLTFSGDLDASSLTTAANNYALTFNGSTTSVAGDTTFANSGALTLGNGGDTLTFTGGLDTTSVAGTVTLAGTVQTANQQIDMGSVTVASATQISSGSAALTMGAVTAATHDLTLTADSIALGGNFTGTGAWILEPGTASRSIGLAGAAGGFSLDATELGRLSNGSSSLVTIGRSGGSGTLTANAFSFDDPLALRGGPMIFAGTLSKSAGGLNLQSSGAVTGAMNLSAGTGLLSVNAKSVNLTGTLNGLSGASAASQAVATAPLGAGPYLVNGVAFATVPAATLSPSAANLVNKKIGVIAARNGPTQEGNVVVRQAGGSYSTPSAAAFATTATASPYIVRVSTSGYSLSAPAVGSPGVNGGPAANPSSSPEMGSSIDDSNEFLRNFATPK